MLMAWPSHFMDVGALFFVALALHEVAHRRLSTCLMAVLGSLLSKEVGVLAVALVPWLPVGSLSRRERWRWTVAVLGLVAAWGLAYVAISRHAGLSTPYEPVRDASGAMVTVSHRYAWAIWNSARATFSLSGGLGLWDAAVAAALGVLLLFTLARVLRGESRRDGARAALPWMAWGAVWFVLATAPVMAVYPAWAPYRSAFGSIGSGAALAALLGAAGPGLLAGLVAVRLATFAASPGPPRHVSPTAPDAGAAFDFVRLVRLERLIRDIRETLAQRYPTLPRGARITQLFLPWGAEYAFAGDKALQVWYRDTTLRRVRMVDFLDHPETGVITIIEYESRGTPQIVLIEPGALRHSLEGVQYQQTNDWGPSLEEFDRADSTVGPDARAFRATVAGARALSLAGLRRDEAAEREARRGIALWPEAPDGHFVLGLLHFRRNRMDEAIRELDSTLTFDPQHARAQDLKAHIEAGGRAE